MKDWTSWRRCRCGALLFLAFDREGRHHWLRHGDGEALAPPVPPYYETGTGYSKDADHMLPLVWVEWLESVHAYESRAHVAGCPAMSAVKVGVP